jgi:GMP synthase (glutamine-hydrolysing)
VSGDDALVRGLPPETTVWMSHGDQVHELPAEFVPLATTPTCDPRLFELGVPVLGIC